MDRGGTQPLQCIPVRRGAVAFVVRQVELRVVAMKTPHDPVAGDLRDDGRRRDARRHHVPLLHAERWAWHPGHREPVGQHVVGNGFEGADASPQQREVASMEAARVDHIGLDLADRVQARRHDPFALHLTLLRGEELRVADPRPVEVVG